MAEDLHNYPTRRDTPALSFMQLDAAGAGLYAASGIIDDLRLAITSLAQDYSIRPKAKPLTFDEFRTYFLKRVLTDPIDLLARFDRMISLNDYRGF